MTEVKLNGLSEKVIGCAYTVSNKLGAGFLEKVYENALAHEIRKLGLRVETQKPIPVIYDSVIVGEYFADLLIEGVLLVELKSQNPSTIFTKPNAYLNATRLPLCLLINFGQPRIEIKRVFQSKFLSSIS